MRETDSHVIKHTKYFNSCNADYPYTAEIATVSVTVLLLKTHKPNNKRAKFLNAELSRAVRARVVPFVLLRKRSELKGRRHVVVR